MSPAGGPESERGGEGASPSPLAIMELSPPPELERAYLNRGLKGLSHLRCLVTRNR